MSKRERAIRLKSLKRQQLPEPHLDELFDGHGYSHDVSNMCFMAMDQKASITSVKYHRSACLASRKFDIFSALDTSY